MKYRMRQRGDAVACRFVVCLSVLISLVMLSSCTTTNVGTAAKVSSTLNFVGRLSSRAASAAAEQTPLLAFITMPKDDGTLDVRAYMCDGQEDGELMWVRGPAQPAGDGTFAFDLTSASGYEVSGTISASGISGELQQKAVSAVGDPPLDFSAPRAAEGSGIFDLTMDAGGLVTGNSLTGDTLSLSKSSETSLSIGDGRPFNGTLTTVDGQLSTVQFVDLSTLSAEELAGDGFDAGLADGTQGVEAGTFRAIVLLDGGELTAFGRLLLPGTGVNGIAPKFGAVRVAFTSRGTGVLQLH